MEDYGFEHLYSNYSLFTLEKGKVQINILVYVDDLSISGNEPTSIWEFEKYLDKYFHMKDLDKLKYCLGVEVSRNCDGIFLSQYKYALDIISEVGLLGAKPVGILLEQNH